MICPDWQYPHCGTCASIHAVCSGCVPLGESPSIVVIAWPVAAATGVTHDRTAVPSRWTVHAPHCAIPHPNFVPVKPALSRIAQSSGMSGVTSSSRSTPLIFRVVIASLPFDLNDPSPLAEVPGVVPSDVEWRAVTATTAARTTDRELTVRGLALGVAITLVFTAANVYLGLKVGLTFASSIPAAVISMAVLRAVGGGSLVENNIVQTVASAAGTLASVIFVLPGLIMVGWWTGFPFWESFAVCALGGILGVMYTVPLRRALVTNSDLPYPEGVAAAQILRVGAGARAEAGGAAENRAGLRAVVAGSVASAGFGALAGTKFVAGELDGYFRIGPAATGLGVGLSLALLGAGHLVGLSVGLAMLVGLVIAWGIATPLLVTLGHVAGPAETAAVSTWAHQVRFIGAGAIGIAAIWTLVRLARPVFSGLVDALATARRLAAPGAADVPRAERDVPIRTVGIVVAVSLVPLAALAYAFVRGGVLAPLALPLVIAAVAYVTVVGFLVAAVCGYMAGLIGSSNSPVSGLAILSVLGAALLFTAIAHGATPGMRPALVAFALFITAICIAVATIANDNLQDLKTGQLVDATPWKQQVALVVGVLAGSIVIPPILNLLARAYGFAGGPAAAAGGAQPLPAPQAALISALARGVVGGSVPWGLIGIGALVGAGLVAIDAALAARGTLRLPPLAVGIGIYLPASVSAMVVVGAVLGHYYEAYARGTARPEFAQRMGVLLASGLIVGESLFGVLLAGLIVASGKGEPLALAGDGFAGPALALGFIVFGAIVASLYAATARAAGGSPRA